MLGGWPFSGAVCWKISHKLAATRGILVQKKKPAPMGYMVRLKI